MQLIASRDLAGFQSYLRDTGNTICGRNPIELLLATLDALDASGRGSSSSTSSEGAGGTGTAAATAAVAGSGAAAAAPPPASAAVGTVGTGKAGGHAIEFLAYAQSSRVKDADDSSVSYAAAVVTL